MLDESLFTFNSQLTKNNLTPLKVTPTALSAPASCTFVWPSGANRQRPCGSRKTDSKNLFYRSCEMTELWFAVMSFQIEDLINRPICLDPSMRES